MARPGFRNHPKFRRLVKMLAVPEPHALGLCEFLWSVGYENGNPEIGESLDVELNAGWTGQEGVFFDAMLKCGGEGRTGLIEPIPDRPGRYQIHDLVDHAPEYVKARNSRETERSISKSCDHCGTSYRSPDRRSLYCSDRCKVAAHRAKNKSNETDLLPTVTEVTLETVTVTQCNPTPAPHRTRTRTRTHKEEERFAAFGRG